MVLRHKQRISFEKGLPKRGDGAFRAAFDRSAAPAAAAGDCCIDSYLRERQST